MGDLALKVNMSSMVDTWNHFAFIINQSRIMTYVNGELASTTAVGRFKDVDGDLVIGALADVSLPLVVQLMRFTCLNGSLMWMR